MCALHVGERRPWPDRHSRASSASTRRASAGTRRPGRACSRSRSRARRGRAGGRRRSAAAARAGTGRRATARGRASRARSQAPRSVSISTPGSRSRSGSTIARDAEGLPARAPRRSGAAAPRARRSGARPRCAARAPRSGSSTARGHVRVVGVHPQLAAGALDDRRRLAVVVGVRVRADEQAHVLEPQADLSSARSRWASEPGSCMPVSNSTIPSPAATAHALQCGTPGHGSGRRSRQTPGSRARRGRPRACGRESGIERAP